jgi:hypothetical protein
MKLVDDLRHSDQIEANFALNEKILRFHNFE